MFEICLSLFALCMMISAILCSFVGDVFFFARIKSRKPHKNDHAQLHPGLKIAILAYWLIFFFTRPW